MSYSTSYSNPKRFRALTGIGTEHFDELLPYFHDAHDEYFRWHKFDGKPNKGIRAPRIYRSSPLPGIEDRLYFILYYLKNNPLQEAMADHFHMESGQCNRWIHCLYGILKTALKDMGVTPATDRRELENLYSRMDSRELGVLVHDASERPVPRPADPVAQKENYSGKKKTHTVKNGIIATIVGAIIFVSQTFCGKTHDKLIADTTYFFPSTSYVLQDTGYQGYSGEWKTFQPQKKPRGKELTDYQKEWNRNISSLRVTVENHIGSAKIIRIIKDECRVRKDGFVDSAFLVGASLHNLRLGVKLPLLS